MRKRVIIVGATGSIGRQALDVVDRRPDLFEVVGLSAHRDEAGLLAAALAIPAGSLCLSGAFRLFEDPPSRPEGLGALVGALEADIVVNGASGSGASALARRALERQGPGAREQRERRHGLVPARGRGGRAGPRDRSGRFGARGPFPAHLEDRRLETVRGGARGRRIDDHGIGRSFPRQEPVRARARQARRGGLAPRTGAWGGRSRSTRPRWRTRDSR